MDIVVSWGALGSRDGTERVEVAPDQEVLILPSFTGGGHVGHHNLLLLPKSQEEVATSDFFEEDL